MAQKTNLNISPYYDDFDANKNFYKILFKPGVPVQARELTSLQSYLQNQLESFGSNIFKDGSAVVPGNITYDSNYFSVKINPSHLGIDVEFYTDQLIGKKITGESSQLTALVVKVLPRSESIESSTTLYVKYLGSDVNFQTSQFLNGETLLTQESFNYGNTTITAGSTIATTVNSQASSIGSAVSISRGIYFIRGYFVNVEEDTLILDQYTNTPSYRVGLSINEEVITSESDNSLYDNAKGFFNYSAPGADRLKITTTLTKKSLNDFEDKDFIEILKVINGEVKKIKETTNYSLIKDYIAKRSYEESGNYNVTPFQVDVLDSLNNLLDYNGIYTRDETTDEGNIPSEDLLSVKISPGKAYVGGYDIEKSGTSVLDILKTRTTNTLKNRFVPFEMGNLIILNNVSGTPALGINNDFSVDLHNRRKSSNIIGTGTTIGKARLYSFSLTDAAYQNESTKWDCYLYDVQTYTFLTINPTISSADCPQTSYVRGLTSGASGYTVNLPSGDVITLSETSGTFIDGEQVIINEKTSLIRNIKLSQTYGSQDVKSIYQNSDSFSVGLSTDFSADAFLERKTANNFNVSDLITITEGKSGLSTATSPGKNFVGIKSDTIIRYQVSGLSTESYNRVASVSSDGLSMILNPIPNVSGVCVGELPSTQVTSTFSLGVPSIKNTKSTLYTKLNNTNISSVDLSNSSLTVNKQITGKSTSASGELTLSIASDVGISSSYFSTFTPGRYSIFYSDGTVENLSSSQVSFGSNNEIIYFSGLKTSKTNVTANVTISKNSIVNKKKIYTRSQKLEVNKTASGISVSYSGLSTNSYYGLRIEDMEISLNVPDVVKILGIYESLDNSSPILDKLTFNSGLNLNTNAIIGEKITGAISGAIGQIISAPSSTTVEYVNLNSNKFESGELVKFEESKISGIVNSIDPGAYIDKTNDFTLEKGQKEQYYDYSRIVRKKSSTIPAKKLLIVYDCYTVPSNDNGDVYTANSYDQERFRSDIPTLNENIRASDTLDIRPRVDKFTSVSQSPFSFFSRNFSSSVNPKSVAKPNENSSVGYSYYLPRVDKLILKKDGSFAIISGTPSDNPKNPSSISDEMEICFIEIPPYVYNVNDIKVKLIDNKRFTMKDIGKIEERLKNLENFSSLSALESDTKTLQIIDEDGISKFKSGFFVDNFKGNSFIDTKNPDSAVTVDLQKEELRPDISIFTLKSKLLLNSSLNSQTSDFSTNLQLLDSNVKKTGDFVTLNYTETVWTNVSQNFATKSENINPFNLTDYSGFVNLRPSSDCWVKTINNNGKNIIKNQSEWKNSFISNLLLTGQSSSYLKSRNIEFISGDLSPLTKYNLIFDGKTGVDIIPKLLQISMTSGTFQSGEIVDVYVGKEKVASFRLCNLDHKFGTYNSPSQTFTENPYSSPNPLLSYSTSSSVLNIDTYSLSDESDGRFYGYTPKDSILIGKTSGAEAKVSSQELITDSLGDLIGCIFIREAHRSPLPPTIFNSGTKTVKITVPNPLASSNVTYCENNFYTTELSNDLSYTNSLLIRRPILSRPFSNIVKDPLIQTFRTDTDGGFLTSIDLFFKEKDTKEKLTIEIREVDLGGQPTNKLVQDFARVQILPSQISISTDGDTPTNIKLPSPLYLEPNRQYALCIFSPSSSKYELWIGESNKPTVKTQFLPAASQIIYSNQYIGGNLFKPQNGGASTPIISEDLKFVLYKSNFTSSSGTVYFTNPDLGKNDTTEIYDKNFETLSENPITMYPRKQVVGILTTYGLETIMRVGRKVYDNSTSATAIVENVGGNISQVSITNVGSGYSTGTYNNVPLYKINGIGQNNNATANITFSNGSITSVAIASTGNGYVVGDLLGITTSNVSKGYGGSITVTSRANIDTLYLTNLSKDTFNDGNTISYDDNGTKVSLAGTTVRGSSYYISDLYKGDVFKVQHYNHGMHGNNNRVVISGVSPDTIPEKLTSSIVTSSTQISVASTAVFINYEGEPVTGINTGYVLINNEIISYNSVGTGVLNILNRSVNGSSSRNHNINDLVYKYEVNGVSLMRINTSHTLPSETTSQLLYSIKNIDEYYLKIPRTDKTWLSFTEQKTSGGLNCKATQNYQYNSLLPSFNTISPKDTSINSVLRSVSGTSASGSETSFLDQQFEPVSINEINDFTTPRIICSKINEVNNITNITNSKSIIFGINLTTQNSNLSPMVDITNSASFIGFRNRLNKPISNYPSDSRSNNLIDDPHSSVYISNQINLLKPATSLKVITTAYRHSSSNFRVLYKLIRADSSEVNQSYEYFPGYLNLKDSNGDGIGDIVIDRSLNDGLSDVFVSPNSDGDFSEYQFTINNLEQFTGFSIKIVMIGTNESYPLRFKDLRVIALA